VLKNCILKRLFATWTPSKRLAVHLKKGRGATCSFSCSSSTCMNPDLIRLVAALLAARDRAAGDRAASRPPAVEPHADAGR
jgi:hypothetical protein